MRLFYYLATLWMAFCLSDAALAKPKTKKSSKPRHTYQKSVKKRPVARQVYAQSFVSTSAGLYGTDQLVNELNRILIANKTSADIAVYVKSMKYGDTLYTRNIDQPMTPASTMKVLTAEAALIYLGSDYRFATQLLTDAKAIKNGALQGNLYIVLSGDPTLTYYDLADLLLTLKSHQIASIAGNVYIDDTAYDKNFYGPGWIWKDKGYCYAAPIGASIINHNCLPLSVTPAKTSGYPAQVVTSPKFFYPTIRNSVLTKSNHSSCSIHLSNYSGGAISIDGCMPKGHYAWGASYVVADIPEYSRALIKGLLSRSAITVSGNVSFAAAPDNISLISQHTSKPLRELITEMLKKSDNIIAGALFKKLGQLYTRKPGSWENGSLAVSQILHKNAGVNVSGLRILDGSGLSPDNLAKPEQMMQVLDFAYHHAPTSDEFISALPIAGVDGTLKHRMWNIARKVRAKTGTISGVVSLAGYAVSGDKEPLAFVIMINGHKGMGWSYKSIEDKIATALTRYKRIS